MTTVDLNFAAVAPVVTLAVAALLVLVLDLVIPYKRSRPWWYVVSLGGILLAMSYAKGLWVDPILQNADGISGLTNGVTAFGGAFILDRFGLIFSGIVLGAAFLAVLLSFFRKEEDVSGYLALVLWAAMGMILLAGAGNFLTLFLGLEILSLSLYVVVAFGQGESRSKEAAFKYLVLGSVASAAMLYGFAFIYGQTGTMSLAGIAAGWTTGAPALMKVGLGLVLLSFAFKLALVPFHLWAPDVYEGASAPITAFMSVGTRAAAFAGLTRFLMAVLPEQSSSLVIPLWILAGLSMVIGSFGACLQVNVKRILAYSSIAHAGYLTMALLGMTSQGVSAGAFYLIAYLFMNTGAFAVVVWLSKEGREGERLTDMAGLFYRRPVLAGSMTLFMLSLAGFPTTAGFAGKLFLVSSAVASGTGAAAAWLIGALAVTSAVSAYAYIRVIMTMFSQKGQVAYASVPVGEAAAAAESTGETESGMSAAVSAGGREIGFSWSLALVVLIAVIGTLYLGIVPKSVLASVGQLLPLP